VFHWPRQSHIIYRLSILSWHPIFMWQEYNPRRKRMAAVLRKYLYQTKAYKAFPRGYIAWQFSSLNSSIRMVQIFPVHEFLFILISNMKCLLLSGKRSSMQKPNREVSKSIVTQINTMYNLQYYTTIMSTVSENYHQLMKVTSTFC